MSVPLPDESTRWRCGGCGNLTRFDVTRTRRTTEFWQFPPPGGVSIRSRRRAPTTRTFGGDLPVVREVGRHRGRVPRGSGHVGIVTEAEQCRAGLAGSRLDGSRRARRAVSRRVRARVVALASDALGRMSADVVPTTLKRGAAFARHGGRRWPGARSPASSRPTTASASRWPPTSGNRCRTWPRRWTPGPRLRSRTRWTLPRSPT